MSHSQFHSTNLFILRHAWLNLWDKHMTTGRINQVTTFQKHTARKRWEHRITRQAPAGHLSFGGSSFFLLGRINFITLCAREKSPRRAPMSLTHKIETALSPDLTSVQTHWLLCLLRQKNHGLLRELPCDRQTVIRIFSIHQAAVDSQVSWLHQAWPSASSPHPFPLRKQQHSKRLCAWLPPIPTCGSGPFQISISCDSQRCVIDSAQDKPADPHFWAKQQRHTLCDFNLCTSSSRQRSSRSLY